MSPIFQSGDRVKVLEGTFVGLEGRVTSIIDDHALRAEFTIPGYRCPVPVELEFTQVEPASVEGR